MSLANCMGNRYATAKCEPGRYEYRSTARERLHHEDFTLIADRVAKLLAIGNHFVIDKHHDVLTEPRLIIQHVTAQARVVFKNSVERLPHVACVDVLCRAIDMFFEMGSEMNPRHGNAHCIMTGDSSKS